MKYLLDTNALLYIFSAPSELSVRARSVVRRAMNLHVSVVSLWEIAIKQSIGKLQLSLSIPALEGLCHERDIRVLGIDSTALDRIKTLPRLHNDPFDRLLVAQALTHGMTLITRDRTIPRYPVQTLW